MSILVRYTPASVTKEQYDESVRRMEAAAKEIGDWPPDGFDLHVAFGTDGDIRVSEIWETREQWEEFGRRIMPFLADIEIDPGEPELLEVHHIIRR